MSSRAKLLGFSLLLFSYVILGKQPNLFLLRFLSSVRSVMIPITDWVVVNIKIRFLDKALKTIPGTH